MLVAEDLVQGLRFARVDTHHVPSVCDGRVPIIFVISVVVRPCTRAQLLRTAHRDSLPHPNGEAPYASTHTGRDFHPLGRVMKLQNKYK